MSFANVSFHVNSGLIPQLTTGFIILMTVMFKLYKKTLVYIGAAALLLISINQAHSYAMNTNSCNGPDLMYRPHCVRNYQNNTNYWGQPWGNRGYYPYGGLQFHTNWGGGNWGAPWYFQSHGPSPYAPYCPQCMQNNPMYNQMWNPWHQNSSGGGGHGPMS